MSSVTETSVASAPFAIADYKTDLKPVWCPGCGDFGVVSSLYKAMVELQLLPWETIVVSGIGCSSRLPGYVSTYGFNSLHGRALPLAMGAKVARPELNVIAVGGDGDGFAIGGNHFMHAARRNLDLAYFVMDNEIYGLTKGQAAPTTPTGDRTKSTVFGNPEPAIDPVELAISVGATWVGRGFSGDPKGLVALMVGAMQHHGFAFLNILSPCVTWRGDDQFKTLRTKVRAVPPSHDRTDRAAAMKFTREEEIVTTGVLYEVHEPSFLDRLGGVKKAASQGRKEPTTRELLERFYPRF
jgi:2-oxoglutarate/2-oxoacid ferredoxin oxidoreductase subunit beta